MPKNIDDLKEEIKNITNNEYILISNNYVNNKQKLIFKHTKCNNTFECTSMHFIYRNQRCPFCREYNSLLTTEKVIKKINDMYNDEYTLLSECNSSKDIIILRHNICGNMYNIVAHNFLNNKDRCPFCFHPINKTKTQNQFIEDIKKIYDNDYEVLGKYINNETKIKVKHKCGYIYNTTPTNILQGYGCPKCAKNIKRTTEDFKKEVKSLTNNEYIVKGEYINIDTPIEIMHTTCGNIYKVTPNNFIHKNQRCPKCLKRSKGEEIIEKWLNEHNFEFIKQFTFDDCKYKRKLPFDFKLECEDGTFILIEYDGEQHFKKCWYDKDEDLIIRKKRDKIKTDYCNNHSNIELLRISFKDDIETVLDGFFKNYE